MLLNSTIIFIINQLFKINHLKQTYTKPNYKIYEKVC